MSDEVRTILSEFRAGLERLYGVRLVEVVLFGSQARGDAGPDSDIDVLIVLQGPLDHWAEIQRTSALSSDISIAHGAFLSRFFATPEEMARLQTPFYHNVRTEGVAV